MFSGIFVALLIAVTQPPDNEAYRRKGSLQPPMEFENKVHHGHRSVRYPSDVTPSVRGQKVLSSLSPFYLVRNASPRVMLSSFKTDPFLIKPVWNTFLRVTYRYISVMILHQLKWKMIIHCIRHAPESHDQLRRETF